MSITLPAGLPNLGHRGERLLDARECLEPLLRALRVRMEVDLLEFVLLTLSLDFLSGEAALKNGDESCAAL
jgi:hypothetical protein